jgi:hypothetical protein
MRRSPCFLLCAVVLPFLAACSGLPTTTTQQVTVVVTPATPSVNVFGMQPFGVTVTGTSNKAVTWQVNGVTGGSRSTGFISSAGVFVAPGGVPTKSDGSGGVVLTTVTVTAISQANSAASGSTTVTIQANTNQNAQAGPIELGTSGGNVNDISGNTCCSGTLGSLVIRNGILYILSNNHVLAKSDFATADPIGSAGDAISQPGITDAPKPNTCTTVGTKTVANLSAFFNLQTGPAPKVDAAIAEVVSGMVDGSGSILFLGNTQTSGIPDPGAPTAGVGIAPGTAMGSPHNGLVVKSGRTTGLTCSSIIAANVATSVDYTQNCDGTGTKFTVNYTDLVQVTGGNFSAPGDSGSLIVTQDTAETVALLFAGNDSDTVGNAISDVLNAFPGAGNVTPTIVGGATHAVLGCTLPTQPASAIKTLSATALAPETLQQAAAVRDAHGPELMAHSEVQAVGVGASFDNPDEPAIVFFVTAGQPRSELPIEVEGVRTRIVENDFFARRGLVSAAESSELERSAAVPQLVYPVSQAELTRAKAVQTAHVAELLMQAGVQGVGITSSVDSPGEAALMIYLLRGVKHAPLPGVIDGLRTRIREGSRFRAGVDDARSHQTCSVPAAKIAQAKIRAVAVLTH